jgi:uncharacterized oligopeptide transporter (OPT) family protein
MCEKQIVDKWRIETNERYHKIVASVISLSTGALMLPVLFFREFIGLEKSQAIAPHLNSKMYTGLLCLALSILFGLIYSWLSVKWIKLAWHQKIKFSEGWLEFLMDASFVLMGIAFLVGVLAIIYFFTTFTKLKFRKRQKAEE